MKFKITFQEEALGTMAADPKIHEEFIASKAPDAASLAEEVASIGIIAATEKQMTLFPRTPDGKPFLWDYQVKGLFKEACSTLNRIPEKIAAGEFGHASKNLKAFRKIIDGMIFIYPRKIMLQIPEGGVIGNCQRPIRVQTMQGERVSLANSETVPEGTTAEFEVKALSQSYADAVTEWMDYGALKGLLQWRNSGKGRFTWERID